MDELKESVIVTGGSSGIGIAIVKKLLKSNMNIVVFDKYLSKDLQKLIRLQPNLLRFIEFDFKNPEELKPAFDKVSKGSQIVALVNNAGICLEGDLLQKSLSEWNETINVNLTSPYVFMQLASKYFIENKISGSIINITSLHSEIIREVPDYSASKAGLKMLTKEFAFYLSKYGIRVNAIAPGSIQTNMILKYHELKDVERNAKKRIPTGRVGQPNEIAEVVEFLLSEKAGYITGETIKVDGGLSLVI
jgi:NAD(P)-dependent dehydrogenase (short-subunit alcohol dehydrogenase family)